MSIQLSGILGLVHRWDTSEKGPVPRGAPTCVEPSPAWNRQILAPRMEDVVGGVPVPRGIVTVAGVRPTAPPG